MIRKIKAALLGKKTAFESEEGGAAFGGLLGDPGKRVVFSKHASANFTGSSVFCKNFGSTIVIGSNDKDRIRSYVEPNLFDADGSASYVVFGSCSNQVKAKLESIGYNVVSFESNGGYTGWAEKFDPLLCFEGNEQSILSAAYDMFEFLRAANKSHELASTNSEYLEDEPYSVEKDAFALFALYNALFLKRSAFDLDRLVADVLRNGPERFERFRLLCFRHSKYPRYCELCRSILHLLDNEELLNNLRTKYTAGLLIEDIPSGAEWNGGVMLDIELMLRKPTAFFVGDSFGNSSSRSVFCRMLLEYLASVSCTQSNGDRRMGIHFLFCSIGQLSSCAPAGFAGKLISKLSEGKANFSILARNAEEIEGALGSKIERILLYVYAVVFLDRWAVMSETTKVAAYTMARNVFSFDTLTKLVFSDWSSAEALLLFQTHAPVVDTKA